MLRGGHLALRHPLSCRPTALRHHHHHLLLSLLLISVSCVGPSICVRRGLQCACRPPLSVYLIISHFLTYVRSPLVASDDAAWPHIQYVGRIIILWHHDFSMRSCCAIATDEMRMLRKRVVAPEFGVARAKLISTCTRADRSID